MKPRLPFYLGCFLAGAALAFAALSLFAPQAPAGGPGDVGHSSVRTSPAAAESARERLRELAHDPYAVVSPEEIASLSAALDLSQPSTAALLNNVLNPSLRTALWKACMQAAVSPGGVHPPLDKLFEIASRANVSAKALDEVRAPLFASLRSSPQQREIFSHSGSGLLNGYLNYWGENAATLQDAYDSIPPQFRGFPLSSKIGNIRLMAHPDAAHFQEQLANLAAGRLSSFEIFTLENNLWNEDHPAPEVRATIIPLIGQLPAASRNDVLMNLPVPADNPATQAAALAEMTSSGLQASAIHRFIYQKGTTPDTPDDLEAALRAQPDSPAVASALEVLSRTRASQSPRK